MDFTPSEPILARGSLIIESGMSRDIPIDLIDPDLDQPRTHFDLAALEDLSRSMDGSGLASPVLVRPVGDRFILVHGERRWRAAKSLGWETIPATIRDLDPDTAHWLALVENVQRSDLTPIEEALAFKVRLDQGITQTELGRRIGKSQSYIAHKLRLLTLPAPLVAYLASDALSEGHMRVLLKIRAIYEGEKLKRGFGVLPQGLNFADRATVFALLRDIRPEDNPPCWIAVDGRDPIPSALTGACHAFTEWLNSHEGVVPSWVVAAFWWASFAVWRDLSVADLALAIAQWRERLRGAIFLFVLWSDPDTPEDELSLMEWYGCRADLRHAGFDPQGLTNEQRVDAKAFFDAVGSVPLPSAMQAWGFERDRYQELRSAREAVIS